MRKVLLTAALALAAFAPAAMPAAAAQPVPKPNADHLFCVRVTQKLADLERTAYKRLAELSPTITVGDNMRDVVPGERISDLCVEGGTNSADPNGALAATAGSDEMRKCVAIVHRLSTLERNIYRAVADADPNRTLGDLMRDFEPGGDLADRCADGGADPAEPPSLAHRRCIALVQRISDVERRVAHLKDAFPGITLGDGMRDVKPGQDVSELCTDL